MTLTPRARTLALLVIATATAAAVFTSGCGDSYRPDDTPTDADGSFDGTTTDGGSPSDAAADASACGADLQNDPKNCGRCGHDCLGGACGAGKCKAIELAAVNAPLAYALVSGSYVYVSTMRTKADQAGGIWRVPKAGGVPEPFVTLAASQGMAVLGDTLYFVDYDLPANGADKQGGLYSCLLPGPAPCAPTLIAAAEMPRAITVDQGRVLYTDEAPSGGLMVYAPPAAPMVLVANMATSGFGGATSLFVDGTAVFVSATLATFPQRARLLEILPDGGDVGRYTYTSTSANAGCLVGGPDDLFYSAFDHRDTAGGIVRRLARSNGAGCDLGGTGNVRPYGIHTDAAHVYWANQGMGVQAPFVDGTVVSCERAGCCTTPDVLWTGNQPVAVTGDADALYFTTQPSGSVWKIAKP